jgi:serine/threonine-protein kinase
MDASGQTLATGTVIDSKYRIEAYIGKGGLGVVYRAIHRSDPRPMAVKVLKDKYCKDINVMERFLQVATSASALGHEYICEIIDSGIHDQTMPYVVMPFLEGSTLKKMIREGNGPMQIARVVGILRQTLSALDAVHRAGMSHRDLMPGNIFVASENLRDCVKLVDFGIAEILESEAVSEFARAGTIIGTPYYKAPEQIRGTVQSERRLDIYAAGVILYEALTGEPPYAGKSYNEVLFKIMAGPFLAPSRVAPDVSPSLERVVLKAMAKDPAARFESAERMRDALEEMDDMASFERMTVRPTAATISEVPFAPETGDAPPPSPMSELPAVEDKWEDHVWKDPKHLSENPPPRGSGNRTLLIVILVMLILAGAIIALFFLTRESDPVTIPLYIPADQAGQPVVAE